MHVLPPSLGGKKTYRVEFRIQLHAKFARKGKLLRICYRQNFINLMMITLSINITKRQNSLSKPGNFLPS